MKRNIRLLICLTVAVSLSAMAGCGDGEDEPTAANDNTAATANRPAAPPTNAANQAAPAAGGAPRAAVTGTLRADPNPIQVCDGTGAGKTTILWDAKNVSRVQIRAGSPDGGLMADVAQPQGKVETGKWVTDGATFYLQDMSSGRPSTVSTVTVKVTNAGCR